MTLPHFDGFENAEDVRTQFGLRPEELEGIDIRIAIYDLGRYEGDALVVFRRGGTLYEVNDSHCSCNGLENWSPEETSVEALKLRRMLTDRTRMAVLEELDAEQAAWWPAGRMRRPPLTVLRKHVPAGTLAEWEELRNVAVDHVLESGEPVAVEMVRLDARPFRAIVFIAATPCDHVDCAASDQLRADCLRDRRLRVNDRGRRWVHQVDPPSEPVDVFGTDTGERKGWAYFDPTLFAAASSNEVVILQDAPSSDAMAILTGRIRT